MTPGQKEREVPSGTALSPLGRVGADGAPPYTNQADLHTHTTASDGTLAPADLAQAAAAVGLRAVGVCDHDTTEGVEEAAAAGAAFGLEVVPGVEINTTWQGLEVHVLGYYYRLHDPQLDSLLERIRSERMERVRRMVERLQAVGCPVTEERVRELAGEGAIGRPHVARALVETGRAESERDAFDRFLMPGRPGYVKRYKLSPAEAVKVILAAGGVPVLAHPGLIGDGGDDLLPALVGEGLAGLEVYHADHRPRQVQRYLEEARRYSLIVTGGSDYHGPGRGHETDLGAATVAYEAVTQLRSRAR